MKKRTVLVLALLAASALPSQAVVPRRWEFRSPADWLRGKFNGVSLSWEGVLSLAPREERSPGPSEEFYLSCAETDAGVLYLGTGHSGKVYRIAPDGTAEVYFQTAEMDVTALVLDGQGVLFAATSPNGKIYKIAAKMKGEMFFNPGERYIWDLAFNEAGNLLVAVGESGGVYAVNSQGEGEPVLKTVENHVLCLRPDGRGGFLAGSGGKGAVYRIAAGKVSLLFESPFEEVKGLVPADDGSVFVAAGGATPALKKDETALPAAKTGTDVAMTVSASAGETPAAPPPVGKDASAVFRVASDGTARKVWASDEDLVYTMVREPGSGRILFGTGPKGRLYALDADERASLLIQENAEQIFLLGPRREGIRILSNNPPGLAVLYADRRPAGEYLSPALDAETVAGWGRLSWEGSVPEGALLQFQTRSGQTADPGPTWSDWSPPYRKAEEAVLSPRGRYLQFRAQLKIETGKAAPALARLQVVYLQANLKPEIDSLDWLGPNEVYLEPPAQDEVIWGLDASADHRPTKPDETRSILSAKKVVRQGYQTVVWEARDENDDVLTYALRLKKSDETQWRPLKDGLTESIFAFDTTAFPDGTYLLQLEASDAASNPVGAELRAERTSAPLVIDNSLPVIKNFSALPDKTRAGLSVSFAAEDAFSAIAEAEVMVRPGGWRVVFPTDGICDSQQESFAFTLPLAPGSDNLVVVRVKDNHGNVGVVRQVF
jgi:outer membrane protein assembly factor BamB